MGLMGSDTKLAADSFERQTHPCETENDARRAGCRDADLGRPNGAAGGLHCRHAAADRVLANARDLAVLDDVDPSASAARA